MDLPDDIRAACARVAGRARHVRIVEAAIAAYARTLPADSPPAPDLEGAGTEERAAFSLTLNAINFGSGWFPTLRKPPGCRASGPSRRGCGRTGRGRRASWRRSRSPRSPPPSARIQATS